MMHLFINALAASAGGGLTYIRNLVPHIGRKQGLTATVLLDERLERMLRASHNITFVKRSTSSSVALRFCLEQRLVPDLVRTCGADVLLSAGNFALLRSPVPQILLSRNALYTSSDFYTDLRSRGDYRLWLDTQIKSVFARLSIHAADEVVAPSQAFAEELRRWTGKPIMAIHHGFDRETFVHDPSPLPGSVQEKLDAACGSLRLLFVSHYNYYRNFETLIRAVSLVKRMLAPRTIRLFLTCKLAEGENPGAYGFNSAAVLIRELGLSKEIIQLGTVPYQLLHHLYQAAEVYVTPAYAESFGHPLIEAMSSGLPIVASDLDVHREICGPAAVYFSRFSSQELANWIVEVGESSELAAQLSRAGPKQADTFGWGRHLEEIVSVADRLLNRER